MSNFDQTATTKERIRVLGSWVTESGRCQIQISSGNTLKRRSSASYAKTDEDREGLLELARTWTRAALRGASVLSRSRLPG